MLLARTLRVPQSAGFLISAGTAICGGSAIAAVRSVVGANEEETAVSLTTVFVLNSIALLLFPVIGAMLGLTQKQFGLWAALAIHDTSSVVGAGLKYGPVALIVGTTVKLVRALWIVPLTLGAAAWFRTRAKTSWPWFILFFLMAAWMRSSMPGCTRAVGSHRIDCPHRLFRNPVPDRRRSQREGTETAGMAASGPRRGALVYRRHGNTVADSLWLDFFMIHTKLPNGKIVARASRRELFAYRLAAAGFARGQELVTIPGKRPMLLQNDRPEDLETPVKYLNTWLTPNDVFFVRQHLPRPKVDEGAYRLTLNGRVSKQMELQDRGSSQAASIHGSGHLGMHRRRSRFFPASRARRSMDARCDRECRVERAAAQRRSEAGRRLT